MNITTSSYIPTTLNASIIGTLVGLAFNGKEKDYESGLHYYGARYYDCELLTGWLSVDPMADKYPSLSPYNYCAWNPVKLIDPDGLAIDSSSVSQKIWNMADPDHECYNEEFAKVFHQLATDRSTIFKFEEWGSTKIDGNSIISGSFSMIESNPDQQDKATIGYVWGETGTGMAPERTLFEEVYHAKQFLDGQFGFGRTNSDGSWNTIAMDLVDEELAHKWADRVSGSSNSWTTDVINYYLKTKRLPNTSRNVNEHWQKYDGAPRDGYPIYDGNGVHKSEYRTIRKPQ